MEEEVGALPLGGLVGGHASAGPRRMSPLNPLTRRGNLKPVAQHSTFARAYLSLLKIDVSGRGVCRKKNESSFAQNPNSLFLRASRDFLTWFGFPFFLPPRPILQTTPLFASLPRFASPAITHIYLVTLGSLSFSLSFFFTGIQRAPCHGHPPIPLPLPSPLLSF